MRGAEVFSDPASVALIGASDNPDKVGGRPLFYLRSLGYRGVIYPINPVRDTVQGLPAYPSVADLPETPDVAVIAVAGRGAVDAVAACAARGVKGCVVITSGFAETRDPNGAAMQQEMVRTARNAGMRLVGPNAQGLANFGTGTVLTFSTMIIEEPPQDGPVALVSQSGGMSAIPYGLLRGRGVGVRYFHGTGNDSDVSVAELITATVADPDIKVVCTYLEGVADPPAFERAARAALERGVPIVALVGGRSADGARAAASHTGSLASESVVVDAFLERLGVRRVDTMTELVEAVDLYLTGASVTGERLAIVSNSGGSCVLASDQAGAHALPMAVWDAGTEQAVRAALPAFASAPNPVDITGALLTDSGLVRRVLSCVRADSGADAFLVSLPVSGRGYDVPEFASAVADFAARVDRPVAVTTPQPRAAHEYRKHGLAVYADEAAGIRALAGYIRHADVRRRAIGRGVLDLRRPGVGPGMVRNEADSLAVLDGRADVVRHVLVDGPAAAAQAFTDLDAARVVVKGCTTTVTHKSDFGLVELGCASVEQVAAAAERVLDAMRANGFEVDGVLVEEMLAGAFEVMVGGHRDGKLGAVVLVGAGGKYVEAVPDFAMLLPPFDRADALAAIGSLRMAPLLAGVRGEAPVDAGPWADLAVAVGELLIAPESVVESLDANPVLLVRDGARTRAVVADAVVVERRVAVGAGSGSGPSESAAAR
ncbi:acetate--CoA ligase family protein [uncultured Jatrophihabitans sp.]|uniref:acetate--CoA ligase family protein n=1 Tax=uncultured Jatrophihabitans sp. TaxID=1610747 RepID=UPI0035CA37D6